MRGCWLADEPTTHCFNGGALGHSARLPVQRRRLLDPLAALEGNDKLILEGEPSPVRDRIGYRTTIGEETYKLRTQQSVLGHRQPLH